MLSEWEFAPEAVSALRALVDVSGHFPFFHSLAFFAKLAFFLIAALLLLSPRRMHSAVTPLNPFLLHQAVKVPSLDFLISMPLFPFGFLLAIYDPPNLFEDDGLIAQSKSSLVAGLIIPVERCTGDTLFGQALANPP